MRSRTCDEIFCMQILEVARFLLIINSCEIDLNFFSENLIQNYEQFSLT